MYYILYLEILMGLNSVVGYIPHHFATIMAQIFHLIFQYDMYMYMYMYAYIILHKMMYMYSSPYFRLTVKDKHNIVSMCR